MKIKNHILILAMLLAFKGMAQQGIVQQDNIQNAPSNEIKVNVFNLLFKAADVSYEYLLNENQSLGIGVLFKVQPLEVREPGYYFELDIDYSRNFSITPYYRYYFSKKYAKGFFVEGFAMYATGKEFEFRYNPNTETLEEIIINKYKTFNLGISLGVKIVSRKNLAIDIYFGSGYNMTRLNYAVVGGVTRGGISIGYRF